MNEKPIPASMGERATAIPPASSSIAAMGVRALETAVPEFHHSFLRNIGVREGTDTVMQTPADRLRASAGGRVVASKTHRIERGDVLLDTEKGVRVTVIKCAVGYTKSGSPIHRVVSKKTGNSWKVSEKKLKQTE